MEVEEVGGLPHTAPVKPVRAEKFEVEMATAAASEILGHGRSLQSSTTCTNTEALAVQASLTGFTVEILTYRKSASFLDTNMKIETDGISSCLGVDVDFYLLIVVIEFLRSVYHFGPCPNRRRQCLQ